LGVLDESRDGFEAGLSRLQTGAPGMGCGGRGVGDFQWRGVCGRVKSGAKRRTARPSSPQALRRFAKPDTKWQEDVMDGLNIKNGLRPASSTEAITANVKSK